VQKEGKGFEAAQSVKRKDGVGGKSKIEDGGKRWEEE